MTNKPMLSVERELLESIASGAYCKPDVMAKLRALLDNPVQPPLADLLLASAHSYVKVAGETQNLARHLQSRIEVYFDGEPAAKLQGDNIGLAVDAAMIEMANISPPMRRSECERLIRAAMSTQQQPAPVATISSLMEAAHAIPGFPGLTGTQLRQLAEYLNGVNK